MKNMDSIRALHGLIDIENRKLAEATAKKGRPITCKGMGCCACCREPVYCSDAEVEYLVSALTPEQKVVVTARLKESLAKFRAAGMFDYDLPPVMKWLELNIQCPLLEDGACMVYERRPISCRSHSAVGNPDDCTNSRENQHYPLSKEHSAMCGKMIVMFHLADEKSFTQDNLLALLEKELLGTYTPTASAQQIQRAEPESCASQNKPVK